MIAAQNKAFPLAGLMYANVNVWSKAARRQIATNSDVWNLSKLVIGIAGMMTNDDAENLTKPNIRSVEDLADWPPETVKETALDGLLRPVHELGEGFSAIAIRGRQEFKDTLRGSFRRSTRVREGEFCESIKKGSTANAALCHDAGNNQALGSMPNRSNSLRPSVLSQLPRLIPAADAAASNCDLSSGVIRIWKVGDFPEDECLMSRLIVDMYVPTKLALHQSGTYPNILKPEKETPLKGITSTRQGLTTTVNTSNEVAVMDITTHPQGRDAHTLNNGELPASFIWLIAAVRRDCQTITAKIHHIEASSENEARQTLTREHVTYFAGRIRKAVAHA